MTDTDEFLHPDAEEIGIVARTVAFCAAHKFLVLALSLAS